MFSRVFSTLLFAFVLSSPALHAEVIIEDGDLAMSRAEFEEVVSRWSAEMRQSAANDTGDRLELISIAVANKKLAKMADELKPADDPDAYWKLHFQLQTLKRRFMIKNFVDALEVPDMTALAEERYRTEKDKYAKVPEKRLTSHILFACPPRQCDRETVRPVANEVLEELRAGADFAAMVEKHSGDPSSKKRGGLFDKWFALGEKGVMPRYTGAAFEIEEIGDYQMVETEFGVHIVRLDGIEEAHYLPFEEVKDKIVKALENEYIKLAVTDFENSLRVTDDARIDGAAMEEIFAPYKTAE